MLLRSAPEADRFKTELEKLFNNQIERIKIIKDQENGFEQIKSMYYKFKREHEVIPIEQLQILESKDYYDFEYYEKYKEFIDYVSQLEQHQEEFLNSFFEYIKAHEDALNIYKQEVNEMYIQFGFAVKATHQKEVAQKQRRLQSEPEERQAVLDEEEALRRDIDDEHNRLVQINEEYNKIWKQFKKATTSEQKRALEEELRRKQYDIEITQKNILRMEQEEQEKRSYILEHENMMQQHTMKLFKNLKPSERIPQQATFIPPTVPRRYKPIRMQPETTHPAVVSVPKPPKVAPKITPATTQTSQTQTLVPAHAFRFIENNKGIKFMEPLTPEKAAELAQVKKTVRSVVFRPNNRYERKPHVTNSRSR